MSTDTQHPFGLDDDNVVPCGTPLSEGEATVGDIEVVAFEPDRPPVEDAGSARLPPHAPAVTGDSPGETAIHGGAAQAGFTPAPQHAEEIPYEPVTPSGRAARHRIQTAAAPEAQRQAAGRDAYDVADELEEPGRESAAVAYDVDDGLGEPRGRASRGALLVIAALCAAFMLALVVVLHRGAGRQTVAKRPAPVLVAPATTLPSTPTESLPPQRHRHAHRARHARVATRVVVAVEQPPAPEGPAVALSPARSRPQAAAAGCVVGDLGC